MVHVFMAGGEEWESDANAVISLNGAFSCIREFLNVDSHKKFPKSS